MTPGREKAGAGSLLGPVQDALFIGVNSDQCEKATGWFLLLAVPFKLNGTEYLVSSGLRNAFLFSISFFCFFKVQPQFAPASLVAQMVKNPPAMQENWVRPVGWEDPLEEGMATHSTIVA